MLGLILMAFAFVFFVIAAFFMISYSRVNFIALGLACWVAAEIFGGGGAGAHAALFH
jgi:hypothetical protein